MRIEAYFQQLPGYIDACPAVQSFTITYDKRGSHEGFVRGEIYLVDGSILHMREYVDVQISIDRLAYAYQYMDKDGRLVFRYDNTGHHKRLGLSTYPHHKHDGSEHNVVPSAGPDLMAVLDEIEHLVKLF